MPSRVAFTENHQTPATFGQILLHGFEIRQCWSHSSLLTGLDLTVVMVLVGSLPPGVVCPGWEKDSLSQIERFGACLARKKVLVIARLLSYRFLSGSVFCLLFPVPIPAYARRIPYLLQADTFAAHRLTNPPHPMWISSTQSHVINIRRTCRSTRLPQGAILVWVRSSGPGRRFVKRWDHERRSALDVYRLGAAFLALVAGCSYF